MGLYWLELAPYKLDRWDRGQRITMIRNEKYWGDRPHTTKLCTCLSETKAQLQSFENGQLDYMGQPIAPDPEQYIPKTADPEFMKKFIAYKFSTPLRCICMWVQLRPADVKDKETRRP